MVLCKTDVSFFALNLKLLQISPIYAKIGLLGTISILRQKTQAQDKLTIILKSMVLCKTDVSFFALNLKLLQISPIYAKIGLTWNKTHLCLSCIKPFNYCFAHFLLM